jgi:hypothetical protein
MGDRRVINAWNWQSGRMYSTQVSLELFRAALEESVLQDLRERLAPVGFRRLTLRADSGVGRPAGWPSR